ncbi:hypothetical protein Vi05172_g2430 [Venturia inaequalis]|nr:hypothetical protein Vi05172_g2430 [Venturia inaequalis]
MAVEADSAQDHGERGLDDAQNGKRNCRQLQLYLPERCTGSIVEESYSFVRDEVDRVVDW